MPVQAPDPMFPHALFPLSAVSLLPHWSVALPSSPFTPPQVVIMTGMILMSRLRALLRTDKEKKKQSLPSPISRLHCLLPPSSLLSAGRRGGGLSPCDITALCLPHGGSGFSTMD